MSTAPRISPILVGEDKTPSDEEEPDDRKWEEETSVALGNLFGDEGDSAGREGGGWLGL